MKSLSLLSIVLILISQNCISQNKNEWTEKKKEIYALRNSDSANWDIKMLKEDLEFHVKHKDDWPTKPAISSIPSPVAKYDWGFVFIRKFELVINGKIIKGQTLAYAKDDYNKNLFDKPEGFYNTFFNILILTDMPDDKNSAVAGVSRNYPHYLSTGKRITSIGSIDWVQMTLADQQNFAIVNQRYFDLKYGGNTLIIAPQKDGSLRFLQLKLSPTSISKKQIFQDKSIEDIETFIRQLKENKVFLNFIDNSKTI